MTSTSYEIGDIVIWFADFPDAIGVIAGYVGLVVEPPDDMISSTNHELGVAVKFWGAEDQGFSTPEWTNPVFLTLIGNIYALGLV